MADFEVQDYLASINLGRLGTGTLEGRITNMIVEEDDGTGFKENTVIRSDSVWKITVEWELAGTVLDPPAVLLIPGAWKVKAYLEGWGAGATDHDRDGDSGNISVMSRVLGDESRTGSGESAWLYSDAITFRSGDVGAGPYKLAITVTYEDPPGTPGPMAGFVEFDNMIQIYQAT